MDKRSSATNLFALSLFCFSGAIVYFTIELSRVTQQIPDVLSSIEVTSQKIQPMVKEISHIRDEIPPILAEVKQLREQIPSILEEVKQVRQQIPPVLEEVRNTRPVVTKAIDEVANTRKAVPPMLEQAEKIVSDMREIGQDTSEGAVTGMFTGILKAPFNIISDIGKSIFGLKTKEIQQLTQLDEALIAGSINELVSTNKLGKTRNWSNPQSGNEGSITFKESKVIDEQKCALLHFVIRIEGKERTDKEVTLCLNDDSEWEVLE